MKAGRRMFELYKEADILAGCGGSRSLGNAETLIRRIAEEEHCRRLFSIGNESAVQRVAAAVALCEPSGLFVHTGSPEDRDYIRKMSLRAGEEFTLAIEGHTCHFDLPEDQGRLVDQTYYVSNEGEVVSTLAKGIERAKAAEYVETTMRGIMHGRTMVVGFYIRGPAGAPPALPAVEMTDSFYVIHSADLLYRNAYQNFGAEAARAGHVFTNLHSKGSQASVDVPKARIFMDRSWLTTYSMHCTYAGNSLLLKKGNHRFAVDLCTYSSKGERLSEHMFITGLHGPGGRTTFLSGAAPSGCGKTTTALVGDEFIGDDLAQLWIAEDGTVRAINPEIGMFGIVQDVNRESDPLLMKRLRGNGGEVIWSNVLIDDEGSPHWVGDGDPVPGHGTNWLGEWSPNVAGRDGRPLPPSHPNARFTMENSNLERYNPRLASDPGGIPIDIVTYSGRDGDTMPPVWVALSADDGVAIGASILSAATATEVGASGVKRQPWANAPFIPGPLGDYMHLQFTFFNSPKLTRKPVMAGLNYFLTAEARGGEGKGLLGEKRDVVVWLSWLERYAHDEVGAIQSPIGGLPRYGDLEQLFGRLIGKEYSRALYDRQFALYLENLIARIELQQSAYAQEAGLPPRIFEVYDRQRSGLRTLMKRFGTVVLPHQLEARRG